MSGKEIVKKLVPSIWAGYRERSRIKSKHLSNLNKLRTNQDVYADFDDFEGYTLGHWAGTMHSRVLEEIRSCGTVQSDLSYRIPADEDRERIENLTVSSIRRIRIKNAISFISILIFAILLLFIIIGVSTGVASLLGG